MEICYTHKKLKHKLLNKQQIVLIVSKFVMRLIIH